MLKNLNKWNLWHVTRTLHELLLSHVGLRAEVVPMMGGEDGPSPAPGLQSGLRPRCSTPALSGVWFWVCAIAQSTGKFQAGGDYSRGWVSPSCVGTLISTSHWLLVLEVGTPAICHGLTSSVTPAFWKGWKFSVGSRRLNSLPFRRQWGVSGGDCCGQGFFLSLEKSEKLSNNKVFPSPFWLLFF